MTKSIAKRIIEHPDHEEIISKTCMNIPAKEVHEWLASKYTTVSEKKFVLSEKTLKEFQENYLDIYGLIQKDIGKAKSVLAKVDPEEELSLSIKSNPTYKSMIMQAASQEVDIRKTISILGKAIETRLADLYDIINEDTRNVNPKMDRLFLDYCERLQGVLQLAYTILEAPAANVVQHNVTLQVVDEHITVFHDVIREVLSKMDLETSMYFMEVFNDKFSKLKLPEKQEGMTLDMKASQVQVLQETINKKNQ